MTNLFSIITITRNNLEGLKDTYKSLSLQGYPDYDWIIIDGASDDGTPDFLKTLQANSISEPDTGIYDAMNKGLERATGHYILFMNAGDAFAHPDVLENVSELAQSKPDFIYGDAIELFGDHSAYKPARPYTTIKRGMFTHHQSMFYARSAVHSLHYNTDYKIAADYDFTTRFLSADIKAAYLPEPICIFQPGGLSHTQSALGRAEENQIRKTLGLCPAYQRLTISARQTMASLLKTYAPNFFWALRTRL